MKWLLSLTIIFLIQSLPAQPNVVIILLDDAGWSDFAPFGRPPYPTPHVSKLAEEGTSFYQFYVPQAICSASRSALLSGCYPCRTKVFSAHGPGGKGLSPKYATMAEVLKSAGYATANKLQAINGNDASAILDQGKPSSNPSLINYQGIKVLQLVEAPLFPGKNEPTIALAGAEVLALAWWQQHHGDFCSFGCQPADFDFFLAAIGKDQ